uniref:Cyclin-Q n=3 Tax=Cacopsylla melanoneura TaxID=428564 RepID=A0A8D8Y6R9_9HEMI
MEEPLPVPIDSAVDEQNAIVQTPVKYISKVDYVSNVNVFNGVRFIFEMGFKLKVKPLTISTAAIIFHRFFKGELQRNHYDYYSIGASCIFLASKVQNEMHIDLRDIVNTAHATLHRNAGPLSMGEKYISMQDAISQGELFLMRFMRFNIEAHELPHKYLMTYYNSLRTWIYPEDLTDVPLLKAAYAFLHDFHHDPSILNYKAHQIAIACLYLALQVYGVQVPHTDEEDGQLWYLVFDPELSREKLWEMLDNIMTMYNVNPTQQYC